MRRLKYGIVSRSWDLLVRSAFLLLPWAALFVLVCGSAWALRSFQPIPPFPNLVAKAGTRASGSQSAPPVSDPNADIQKLTADINSLQENEKKVQEDSDKDKEDVKRYLEWVIAVAGIFAVGQTIAAGFAAESFKRQADRDLGEIENWKSKYENLALLDEKQKEALDKLGEFYQSRLPVHSGAPPTKPPGGTKLIDWLDWRRELYGGMRVTQRQELLSVDRYLGFDLKLNQFADPTMRANMIRMLANFYVSKYEYEVKLKSGHWDDLERAEYLLRLWISQHPDQFQFHSDLGVVLIRYADHCKGIKDGKREAEYRKMAKARFENSLDLQPRQQRAYYNLALIAYDLENPDGAKDPASIAALQKALGVGIEYSQKGLKEKIWEVNPAPAMRTEMTYNLACYEALLAYLEATSGGAYGPINQIPAATVTGILDELKEVERAGTIQKRYIDIDFADPDGQIARFRRCLVQADQVTLDQLRPGLSRNSVED